MKGGKGIAQAVGRVSIEGLAMQYDLKPMRSTVGFSSRIVPIPGELWDEAFRRKAQKQSSMVRQAGVLLVAWILLSGALPCRLFAQTVRSKTSLEKVIIDTDIGDDIDDAFAIALALR